MNDDERDVELPAKVRCGQYSAKCKRQILAEYEQLDREGKGALLRREHTTSAVRQRPRGVGARSGVLAPGDVWQGHQDTLVPAARGQAFARALPTATLQVLPAEGHLSRRVNYLEAIL